MSAIAAKSAGGYGSCALELAEMSGHRRAAIRAVDDPCQRVGRFASLNEASPCAVLVKRSVEPVAKSWDKGGAQGENMVPESDQLARR